MHDASGEKSLNLFARFRVFFLVLEGLSYEQLTVLILSVSLRAGNVIKFMLRRDFSA
jgi:hypothetical protein